MSRRLLILRPEPGASATALRARERGFEPIVAPLFMVRPVAWNAPAARPDAVIMTSANAARHGGSALGTLRSVPLYAVGAATAEAARTAGFETVTSGEGDAEAVFALAQAQGHRRLLHLAGREHRAIEGEGIDCRIVYAADAIDQIPEAARAALPDATVLLHSPRAARLFASFVVPNAIALAAISEATRKAAGSGWLAVSVADRPTDASLLDAAARLCDQGR
jgi:uroporphyrinogen-III synthase